jgi:hypothetical protein
MSTGYPVNLTTLITGENQSLGVLETSSPGTYVTAVGATSAADIAIGSPGAAGDKLFAVAVFNGSAQPFTAFSIKDGSTTLTGLTNSTLTTLAAGANAIYTMPGGCLESKNGGWKINITCTGTMASIAIVAVGAFT